MNEKIEKLKQKAAISNLFKNYSDADLVEIKDLDELKIKQINHFLMRRETYTNQHLIYTNDFSNLSHWIAEQLKLMNISNNIIIHILGSDKWMVKLIVKNWENVIDLMRKNGGVCFYDVETKKGICVGFDEESCYIDVKIPEVIK